MAAPGSVSAAFQEYLQHLGLQDFPCGLGSWNKSCLNARRRSRAQPAGLEEAVPAGEETPEALLELLRDQHSPWALPPDCSPQERLLREVAVLAPELLHGSRVFQVVKSLRILDKGPPEDVVLIRVTQMSHASRHVHVTLATRCLRDKLAKPSSLQVEEVDEGVLWFQQLEELVLSANHIRTVTSAHLPRTLKVLELCYNAVGDLQDLCAQPPPELQHLGLGYNQLCGPSQEKHFTVDFWPNLVSLDLSFNSLTDLLGLVSQLSTLQNLRILVLQGNPLALIPTYRGFLLDSLPKLSILDDIHIWPEERQQFHGLARQPELIRSEARVVVSIGDMKGLPNPEAFQQLEVGSEGPVITYSYCVTYQFAGGEELKDKGSPEGTKIHQSPTVAMLDVDSSAQDTGETKSHQKPAATEEPKAHSARVFATPGQPWADTIDCSYRKEHITRDLVGLKSYLEAGTIVSVVEEKVLSWPVDPEENAVTNKKEGQELKKNSAKDKQKKKKQSCEFRSDPPIRSTLGTTRVTLETLLATEDLVATVCDFGILIPEEPPVLEEKEVKKGKDKTKKPKAEKGNGTSQKTASSKGKGKNKDTAEVEEGQDLQPVPLTVQFQMQLLRWPLAASTQRQENVARAVGKTQ
ncbi:leucine-rich repeat-containing protein 43 isoform X1 [Vidua macroura]|uniref:leucine-rich repeat-containing protein 43 isoform X1 n=2 Tax=Vidua macroura TaxID=187451 RepID=UPI0023A8735C|nr:leucine-rich repeat-containing protein 43 isoform X1 [Vidua macroura]